MVQQLIPTDVINLRGIAAKTTISIGAGWTIDAIFFNETSNHAITGGMKIGTTDGGVDVVAAQAVAGNALSHVTAANILKRVFSRTAAQTVWIDAVTAWNTAVVDVVIFCRKAF